MNVAVRLEGLADPGGILISEDAYRQIHGKLEIELRDRGPQHLKNIDEPVRAYAIRIESADTIPSDAPETKSPPSWRVGVAALVIAGLVGHWHGSRSEGRGLRLRKSKTWRSRSRRSPPSWCCRLLT